MYVHGAPPSCCPQVWSCSRCHCVLHLQCIQQWAKDSTEAQQRSTHTKLFPGHAVTWTWSVAAPACLEYANVPGPILIHSMYTPPTVLRTISPMYSNLLCSPKCRLEYQLRDIPSKYLCHCGKKVGLLPNTFHCGHVTCLYVGAQEGPVKPLYSRCITVADSEGTLLDTF